METRKLLAEHARLLNMFGPHSREVRDFAERHSENQDFVELAEASTKLKQAFLHGRDPEEP